jgi:hypothetical protein
MKNKLFKWEKLGQILSPSDSNSPFWMAEYAQAPNAILLKDRIRVYFTSRLPRDDRGQYVSQVGFVDVDRNDPRKILAISDAPVIDLGSPGSFDQHGTYPFSVARVKNEVIAIYGGWSRCSSVPFDVSLGLARANIDNLDFHKVGVGPVLTKSQFEPFVISSPKIRFFNNNYFLFYIAGSTWIPGDKPDPVYSIRMAISDNGEKWQKLNKSIINNVLGDLEAQASPDVFYFDGRYHMLFCYRHGTNFRVRERGYRIGYASSEDLLNWTRDDSMSDLNTSSSGWDSEDISYPNVLQVDDALYCFYLGNQVGREGIGVARLKSYSK